MFEFPFQGYWALIDDTGALPASKQYLSVAVALEDIVVVRETHVQPEKVQTPNRIQKASPNLCTMSNIPVVSLESRIPSLGDTDSGMCLGRSE